MAGHGELIEEYLEARRRLYKAIGDNSIDTIIEFGQINNSVIENGSSKMVSVLVHQTAVLYTLATKVEAATDGQLQEMYKVAGKAKSVAKKLMASGNPDISRAATDMYLAALILEGKIEEEAEERGLALEKSGADKLTDELLELLRPSGTVGRDRPDERK